MRLPGVEPGSIAWKAIILTVGLQTLDAIIVIFILILIKLIGSLLEFEKRSLSSRTRKTMKTYSNVCCVDEAVRGESSASREEDADFSQFLAHNPTITLPISQTTTAAATTTRPAFNRRSFFNPSCIRR